jgi:hypothetical protein
MIILISGWAVNSRRHHMMKWCKVTVSMVAWREDKKRYELPAVILTPPPETIMTVVWMLMGYTCCTLGHNMVSCLSHAKATWLGQCVHYTRVVSRFLCQVRLKLKQCCRHIVTECVEVRIHTSDQGQRARQWSGIGYRYSSFPMHLQLKVRQPYP